MYFIVKVSIGCLYCSFASFSLKIKCLTFCVCFHQAVPMLCQVSGVVKLVIVVINALKLLLLGLLASDTHYDD